MERMILSGERYMQIGKKKEMPVFTEGEPHIHKAREAGHKMGEGGLRDEKAGKKTHIK